MDTSILDHDLHPSCTLFFSRKNIVPGTDNVSLMEILQLDYAVRDRDVSIVWQCYENIAATYDLILSRI